MSRRRPIHHLVTELGLQEYGIVMRFWRSLRPTNHRWRLLGNRPQGFTLVEVLIVSPIIILAISGFVALMITLTGEVLMTREQGVMIYDTHSALERIEDDARLGSRFLVTTGTLPSPQGSNDSTAAFTSGDALIIERPATTTNPLRSDREPVYYAGQPNPCGPLQSANRVFTTRVIYFVKDNALWRRSIVPPFDMNSPADSASVCDLPWQQNSCSTGHPTIAICQTDDAKLANDVTDLSIEYYESTQSDSDLGAANALSAATIEVTLTCGKAVAGHEASYTGSIRATRLNNIGT